MRVLFTVQGEGRGHLTQALAVYRSLSRQGHELVGVVVGSPERDEREWRKIFEDAGFSGYKIVALLGIRSVIEVYP